MDTELKILLLTIFYLICFAFSALINGFLIYLILRSTPQCVGVYKWFLLNMTVIDLLLSIGFDLFLMPIPLAWKPIFIMNGLGKYLGISTAKLIVCTVTTISFLSLAAPLLCFVHRYCVTTTKTAVIVNNNKNAHQNGKMSVMLKAIFFETICALIAFLTLFIVTETDQKLLLRENLHIIDSPNASQWQDRILFAFGEKRDLFSTVISFVVPLMVIITTISCVTLAGLIIKSLNSQKSSMTAATFAMQKRFTHALIIQALYPIILLTVPYLTMVFDILFGIVRSSGYVTVIQFLSLASITFYPIVNAIVTIYFVNTYQIAVLDIVKRICGKRKYAKGDRYFVEFGKESTTLGLRSTEDQTENGRDRVSSR